MLKQLIVAMLVLALLSGCAPATATVLPVLTSTPFPPATETLTPSPATPTGTSAPTETPLPTATFTATPTPVPQPISAENAGKLALARRYGSGRMEQVVWSPDGQSLLLLTSVKMQLYDPETVELIWESETSQAQAQAAFTTDGKSIVSITAGGAVQVRDAATGKLSASPDTLIEKANVYARSISPSGDLVITGDSGRETNVLEVATGSNLASNTGAAIPLGILGVLISPDENTFWISGFDSHYNQQIQSWEMKTGKFIRGLTSVAPSYITQLAVSPDNNLLAGISRLRLSSKIDFTLQVWNTANGSRLHNIAFDQDISTFCFVPGQNMVIVSSLNGKLNKIDLINGEKGSGFGILNSPVISMAASLDGKSLAVAMADGTVQTFDLTTQKNIRKISIPLSRTNEPYLLTGINYIEHSTPPFGISASSDSTIVAIPSADQHAVDLVDPASLKVIRSLVSLTGQLAAPILSKDGKRVAAIKDWEEVVVWDVATGKQVQDIKTGHVDMVKKIAFSPDGKLVASLSGGRLGELYVWDIETGKKQSSLAGGSTMAFSPDGRSMASDNIDLGIYLWDVAAGKKLASPSSDWIYDLDYAPDGKTIAITAAEVHKRDKNPANLVTFLETEKYQALPMQLTGQLARNAQISYSSDGLLLAAVDDNGNVMLWEVKSGSLLAQFNEVAPRPADLAFINNNRTLVVGSGDGTLRFYEVK